MPEWLKQNIPMIALFIIGVYVGLERLEVKFTYQETRAAERYRLLVNIQEVMHKNTQQLTALQSNYIGLNSRLKRIEDYVPSSITDLEKEVALLDYKLSKEKRL